MSSAAMTEQPPSGGSGSAAAAASASAGVSQSSLSSSFGHLFHQLPPKTLASVRRPPRALSHARFPALLPPPRRRRRQARRALPCPSGMRWHCGRGTSRWTTVLSAVTTSWTYASSARRTRRARAPRSAPSPGAPAITPFIFTAFHAGSRRGRCGACRARARAEAGGGEKSKVAWALRARRCEVAAGHSSHSRFAASLRRSFHIRFARCATATGTSRYAASPRRSPREAP